MKSARSVDLLHGSILRGIILYTLPLAFSKILQLFYNAADLIVIGQCAGEQSLAAVGATGSLVNFCVNTFGAICMGTTLVVSRCYGAGDREGVHRMVHTSIPVAAISGVICMTFGLVFSRQLLQLMNTPSDILELSNTYLIFIFIGIPFLMLYNFASAIIMAAGDTRRPLFILLVSGLFNVAMNLLTVAVFHMDVAGVAIATALANVLSAVLSFVVLIRSEDMIHLDWRKLRIYRQELKDIFRLGLPASVQGALFSLSNMMIQTAINGFGSVVVAANSAAASIEGFVYVVLNSFGQAATAFVSQNMGAKQPGRAYRITYTCIAGVTVCVLAVGAVVYLLHAPLLSLYLDEPTPMMIGYGEQRLRVICLTYFLCGIMEVLVGTVRGMGNSFLPMLAGIFGSLGVRWIYLETVFEHWHTPLVLYLSYPFSWSVIIAIDLTVFFVLRRRLRRTNME